MISYNIKNRLFFIIFILTRPDLVYKMLTKRIYLPVYVQFEWLKKYQINTIIDVGAHEGKVAQPLHVLFPNAHIYAFEPNNKLHTTIGSKIKPQNLTLEKFAISNKNGYQKIYFANDATLTSLLPLITPGRRLGRNIKISPQNVKTVTLDSYFSNKNLKGNVFLKIDIEGAESLALKGATKLLKQVAIIHMETYFEKIYKNQELFDKVYDLLYKNGFRYMGIIEESYFYPKFTPQNITNSIFLNTKLIDSL